MKEFQHLFPNADKKRFKEDEFGYVVLDDLYDVSEPAFWDNSDLVSLLYLPPTGKEWYRKNPEGFLEEWRRLKKYDSSIGPKKSSKPPTWGPDEWNTSLDPFPESIVVKDHGFDFENFRIYVNENQYFVSRDTLPSFGGVNEINFKDKNNVYCLSLKAINVLSYLGGIGVKNLNSENKLARSLSHFYFYNHLRKFFNYRDFSEYNTSEVEKLVLTLYHWATHFVWYHSQIRYTEESLKRTKSDIVRNIRRVGNKIYWDVRSSKRDVGQDYKELVSEKCNGLTHVGQLLFQESCQAYVYCVLGAQAKTRWKIVGDGANSLQTQRVFKDLIGEVIKQGSISILIKSMRIAIESTKVRLNFCISPRLELLPSDMVYIKDSPGYNNILLISTVQQKFGENNNVNTRLKRQPEVYNILENKPKPQNEYEKPKPIVKEVATKKKKENSQESSHVSLQKTVVSSNNTSILVTSALLAVLVRLIWLI